MTGAIAAREVTREDRDEAEGLARIHRYGEHGGGTAAALTLPGKTAAAKR
jgi:hypothetical protein